MKKLKQSLKTGLILLSVSGMAAINPGAIAQQPTYPLTIRAAFMHGCLEDEKSNQPVSEDQIKFCLCMMDLIQSKYSYDSFVKLSEAYDKKQPQAKAELERFFKENMNTCL